jgi:hypothetical protein
VSPHSRVAAQPCRRTAVSPRSRVAAQPCRRTAGWRRGAGGGAALDHPRSPSPFLFFSGTAVPDFPVEKYFPVPRSMFLDPQKRPCRIPLCHFLGIGTGPLRFIITGANESARPPQGKHHAAAPYDNLCLCRCRWLGSSRGSSNRRARSALRVTPKRGLCRESSVCPRRTEII